MRSTRLREAQAPVRPRRSVTLPFGRTQFAAGEHPITAFREVGTGRIYAVPNRWGTMTLGCGRPCTMWIPRVGLERVEWALWWNRHQLWVEDQTFEWKTSAILPAPGQVLHAGGLALRAMSAPLLSASTALADLVGGDAGAIDRILDRLVVATTVVVLGANDSGPERLLAGIEHVTPTARAGSVAMPQPLLRPQRRSRIAPDTTIRVDLRAAPHLRPACLDPMRRAIRAGRMGLHVLASSRADVERCLGAIPDDVLVLEVPNLSARPSEIPRLFAEAMARRECPMQLTDLGPENVRAMMTHAWPRNRDDLDAVADQIAELIQHPGNAWTLAKLAAFGLTFPARPPAPDFAKWTAFQARRKAANATAALEFEAQQRAARGLPPLRKLRVRAQRATMLRATRHGR